MSDRPPLWRTTWETIQAFGWLLALAGITIAGVVFAVVVYGDDTCDDNCPTETPGPDPYEVQGRP